jgi:hypothetical protein
MSKKINPNSFDNVGTCELSISRISGPDGQYVLLQISDIGSCCTILEAEFGLEEFAKIITGMGMHVNYGVRNLGKIGKKLESKHEIVNIGWSATNNEIREAVSKFEIDGWVGEDECCRNHHNAVNGGFRVTYVRWVDPEEGGKS